MKLNPNDAPAGYIAVESEPLCTDCAFCDPKLACLKPKDSYCLPKYRKDRHFVIFKKLTSELPEDLL